MKKPVALLIVVTLAAIMLAGAHSPSIVRSAVNTPLPAPTPWPDLTNLKLGTKTCGIDGAGAPGSEKAKLNDLKNRFRLPSGQFQPITFDNLLALNQGHVQGSKIVGFPGSADPNNQRAVTVEGFVQLVFVGG